MISQLAKPVSGETVATMKTSMGDIKIRLFPEAAPKTVENFTTHAKNGYYDGLIFHRVINDFMIQGGDPTGTGCGGESIWGSTFEDEFCTDLHNLRGALSMANAGPGTNGSQFFIVHGNNVHFLDHDQCGPGPAHFVKNSRMAPLNKISTHQAHNGRIFAGKIPNHGHLPDVAQVKRVVFAEDTDNFHKFFPSVKEKTC